MYSQEERQRTKERDQNEVESTSNIITADMSIERILAAERRMECSSPEMMDDVKVSSDFRFGLESSDVDSRQSKIQTLQQTVFCEVFKFVKDVNFWRAIGRER